MQAGVYGRLPRRTDLLRSTGWVSARRAGTGDHRSPGWISGVAMLVRRSDFVALGGFDEAFVMYLEDVDLCRRLRERGRSVGREPGATVVHHGGRSWPSNADRVRRFHASRLLYFERLGATPLELGIVRLTARVRGMVAGRR
jgi:GT2 family glycosyltransferase